MRTLSLLMLLCIVLITTSKAQAPELPAYVPEEGLVGFWTFNGSAEDSSPLAHPTENYEVTFDSTRFTPENQVAVFKQDSACDNRIETFIPLENFEENVSIAFWFKSDWAGCLQGGGVRYLAIGPVGYPLGIQVIENLPQNGPSFVFVQAGQGTTVGHTFYDITLTDWNHMVYTLNDSIATFHLNGEIVGTYDNVLTAFAIGGDIVMGMLGMNFPNHGTYEGLMDDLGFWNRALTFEEVQELYNSEIPTSTQVAPSSTSFKLYPNPSNGILNIEIRDTDAVQHIQISNMLGQELLRQAANSTNISLDLSNVKAGLYLVQLLDKEGSVLGIDKVIIQ